MEFVDDGKHKWQDVIQSFKLCIKEIELSDKSLYDVVKMAKDFIYDMIHNKLRKNNRESEIRELVKYVISDLLPLVTAKLQDLEQKMKKDKKENIELAKELNRFYDLEDDLYALASYRSLSHFAYYMERGDEPGQLVWKYNMKDTMGSIFYYSNSMILDHAYKGLIKQCPTGYGKSKSDCVIICFCFGYDPNDDIMKVVGNKQLVRPITHSIVMMLRSKRFGKVFPEFGRYNGRIMDMFKSCAEADGTFTLMDSKKSLSFACYNKETSIDGGRFNKQFYDDVTQSDDKDNVNAHLKDRSRYESQWKKRQYDEFSCLRWFTGTAYHREDFLSYIKKYHTNKKPLEKENSTKGYKWNRFVRVNNTRDIVYISIPKLADLELGEDKCYCTFPQKYSKTEALKELHSSDTAIRRFMAMEQQQPLPPESLAFDYAYLRQYDKLPDEIKNGECFTRLVIDPSRKGYDNYAGLIFKKPNSEDVWYFVDCFYKKVSSKYALPRICERAAFHKVDSIMFEGNIVDPYQMKKEINELMSSNGWYDYTVDTFYSYKNKEEKISQARDEIRDKIVFPRDGMYYPDSEMGRALGDITGYSFEGKNKHDDSIDCCAMLVNNDKKTNNNEIVALDLYF